MCVTGCGVVGIGSGRSACLRAPFAAHSLSRAHTGVRVVRRCRATTPKGDASNAVLEELDDSDTVARRIAVGARACTVIGRNEELCDVTVNEPSASRKHMAVLFCGAERQFYVSTLAASGVGDASTCVGAKRSHWARGVGRLSADHGPELGERHLRERAADPSHVPRASRACVLVPALAPTPTLPPACPDTRARAAAPRVVQPRTQCAWVMARAACAWP